jgi:hypothetical protein
MNKLVMLAVTVLFSVGAQAQDIKQDIRGLLSAVNSELYSTTASTQDLLRARDQVAQALDILRGSSSSQPSSGSLLCVSKDDDGREPYVLAYRDPQDFSVKKIIGAVLSQSNCLQAAEQSKRSSNSLFFCASSDGDARDPNAVYAFDLQAKVGQKLKTVGSFSDCLSAVDYALISATHFAFCASRDNDGRAPYARISFDLQNKSTSPMSGVFNTLNECNASR